MPLHVCVTDSYMWQMQGRSYTPIVEMPNAPVSVEGQNKESMTDHHQLSVHGAVRTERSAMFECSVLMVGAGGGTDAASGQCYIQLRKYDSQKKVNPSLLSSSKVHRRLP